MNNGATFNPDFFIMLMHLETNYHPFLLIFLSVISRVAILRSQLCACVSSTALKPKTCIILLDIIKPSSLNIINQKQAPQ